MPSYDYLCERCDHREERFLSIHRAPEVANCPKCNGRRTLRKCIGRQPVIADAALKFSNKYPYTSNRLPLQKGKKVVVQSAAHEREIMAGALNGDRYERE